MTSVLQPRRRQRLLAGASVAALTVAMHLAQAAPAAAANECGALNPANGQVSCAPGGYSGIAYGSQPAPPGNTNDVGVTLSNGVSVGGNGVAIGTSGAGNATLNLQGSDSVSTTAANVAGVTINSANKVTVTDAGTGSVATAGAGSAGWSLSSGAAALRDVVFNFFGTTTTSGANSPGVSAQNVDRFGTSGAPNSVGTVVTQGANSNGVDVSIRSGGPAASVAITSPSTITTSGDGSDGIHVRAPAGSASTTVDITAAGAVKTSGANSNAIDVSIDSGSIGVHAGDVSTLGANSNAIDLSVLSSGDIAVDSLKKVSTATPDSKGVVAKTAQGNVSIDASNATIKTGGTGVDATSSNGDATVVGTGATVVTQGDNSAGLSATAADGNASVTGDNASITTKGKGSAGLLATAAAGTANVSGTGTVVATGGDDSAGMSAVNTGTGAATVAATDVTVTTKGKGSAGLSATAATGDATATADPSTITTSGDDSDAVKATVTGTGKATASSSGDTLITHGANSAGVNAANTGTGDANASATGSTIATSGQGSAGVTASAANGNSSAVTSGSTITTSGEGSHGVKAAVAAGGTGTPSASSSGDTIATSGKNAYGVQAINSGSGSAIANTTNSSITTSGDGSHGVQSTAAAGDAQADSAGGAIVTKGAAANGMDARSTNGAAFATAGATVTTSGDGSAGVAATSTGGNAGAATKIGTGATLTTSGKNSAALSATAAGGDATASLVAATAAKTTGDGSAGLSAASSTGNATANTVAGSTVQTDGVGSAGLLVRAFKNAVALIGGTVAVNGTDSKGVDVASTGAGAGDNATATIGNKVVATGANGVGVSVSTNAGTARVDANADVFATGTGGIAIEALSTSGLSNVALNGNVAGAGTGVRLGAAGGNALTVGAGFTLQDGLSGGLAAVHVDNGAASITNNGTVLGNSGALVLADGAAGAVSLTNNGLMSGLVKFAKNDNTVLNEVTGVWTAKGTSDFGSGNNTVVNAGIIKTDPAQAGTAKVVFDRLTNLVNKASGLITMTNGKEGDQIRTGGNYAGEAGARLGVDARLSGPGSRSDTLTVDGNASGNTNVVVNDTNAGGPGRYNRDGITVVTVKGVSQNDTFRLAGGPIDKGLWQYDLARFGDGTFRLVTAPSGEVMAAPSMISQTVRYWQIGQNSVDDHRASIRAMIWGSGPAAAPVPAQPALGYSASGENPFDSVFNSMSFGKAPTVATAFGGTAVWAQVVHASFTDNLNNATSAGSKSWSYDTRTEQDVTRFMAGVDFGAELRGNSALTFGAFGGYGTSDGKMNTTASGGLKTGLSSLAMKGTSVGGYAQYMVGPWWIGGSTLYDSLDNTYRINRVGFSSPQKGSVWGSQIDAGWNVDWRFGSVEPYAAITYLSTKYDSIDSPWGRFDFGSQEGVDGKLGTRFRIPVWEQGAWYATLLGNLAITHGFKEGGPVVFDGFAIPNQKVANWGDIGGGAEFGTRDGRFGGYLKADWLAASGLNGYSFLGGLNYRW